MADMNGMIKKGWVIVCSQIQRKASPRHLLFVICFMTFMVVLIQIPRLHKSRYVTPVYNQSEALRYRPEQCYNCNSHDFKILINSDKVCKTSSVSPEIHTLILIASIHKGRAQRDTYRKTWLTYTKNNTADVRYAFIFGNLNDTEANAALLEESKIYDDILQEDFQDSYINLTIKTMMAFKWASTHCAHAQYLMKTDDDMYVNMPGLRKAIGDNSQQLQSAIGGKCMPEADPVRDKTSKWFVSYQYYPRKSYPGYCAGTGYVTSMAMVKEVFKVSKHLPFFYLEDVFVSLCVERIGKSLHLIEGFNSNIVSPINSKVYKSDNLVTVHRVGPELLLKLWNDQCLEESEILLSAENNEKTWTDC
ncbi:beta-1,3-galactosyltransferase 1-like [Mizuhopecten yessoensis]|uniref:Hexosyltransferase n=1 Tax=Mizuhopecten yessoensis TaxID=6573 RepID=A0A210QS07_MIZYE|nr:beta-1,3-galactosyltransferase 1-like [Mizuhopecten yessoensis]XP_021351339.1 beta-1,3-galactosyltransferase 1-like [Mizuhopecten yessoensis]XP_021351340.1 beta-1,3-galactosyltransferase 1-like [Mizuhopecten yessoensis]XP_021351341.1 beta-1,3-galactosyltransferase 1-like [Mizuhopecten yessoensis]OWF51501.1 Beta-1,3-galactosyltransferase 1 [Mizuhopecten yessoensis]